MKKRPANNYVDDEDDDGHQYKKPTTSSNAQFEPNSPTYELDPETLDKILAEAPPAEELDVTAVKRMILSLEKKINQNQLMRVKFADKPEKFMESEVELDEEIKKMHVLATAPNLYPVLVSLNTVPSLLSLMSHENIDIAVDVVDLLNELTESDILSESTESLALIDALIENEALELLVQNFNRFDEKNNDESQAIHNTMGIFENLMELNPELTGLISQKTKLMEWLLNRLRAPEYDDNKLYASEVLSLLILNSKENQIKFAQLNGFDHLLVALSAYRKQDPALIEEEEMAENLFDCLCAALQQPENQEPFLAAEGIELMLIMVKNKRFCRKSALKVLDYALLNNPQGCETFVKILGLKTLFAAFMKKGSKKHKKGFDEQKDDEHIMSIIVSLFKHLSAEPLQRTLNKFTEEDYQKVERLIELHEKCIVSACTINVNSKDMKLLRAADKSIEQKKQEMDEEDLQDEEVQEEFLLERLDAGLFTLQLVDLAIAFVCANSVDSRIKAQFLDLLSLRGRDVNEVIQVLEEYATNYGADAKDQEKERQWIRELADKLKS